jgi:hypothetical protein
MTVSWAWGKIALGVAVVGLIVVGSLAWLREHDARQKAEMQTAFQQKSIDAAKSDAAQTASQLQQSLAALEAARAKVATAQQILIDGSKLLPKLPQPVVIQAAAATAVGTGPAQPGNPALPDAPGQQLVIPAADFQAIHNAEIDCQESAAKLAACTRTATDTSTELQQATAQRDEWERTAKGGTWWHRTVTAVKWIGIGAATGYVAGRATR